MTSDGIIRESRPVRKVMSRARRAEITENFEQATGAAEERFDFDAVVDNKVSVGLHRAAFVGACADHSTVYIVIVCCCRARLTLRASARCLTRTSCSRTSPRCRRRRYGARLGYILWNIQYTYYIYSSHVLLCVEQVIRVMTQRRVAVDEMVIKEGDRGDEMYIVDRYTPSLLLLCAV